MITMWIEFPEHMSSHVFTIGNLAHALDRMQYYEYIRGYPTWLEYPR